MSSELQNIKDRKFRRLTIKVSLNRLSYCSFDTFNNKIISLEEFELDVSKRIDKAMAEIFSQEEYLQESFDEVVVLHDNNLFTLVPTTFFSEHHLGDYLKYNNKVFDTANFAYDEINFGMNAVYVQFANVNSFCTDFFGTFNFEHASTSLVRKLLDSSFHINEKIMYVYVEYDHFQIAIIENQKVWLFNSFEYRSAEDFIYYILFTSEQVDLNPETMKLVFLGDIMEVSLYYNKLHKYVHNIHFFDVSPCQKINRLTEFLNRKHFLILNS